MKLNGLTNNLKGNDQSLSNSYLQHIVELLRKELESLEVQFEALNIAATEHIETQKTLVETVTVKAEDINGKIKFLSNAIEMFGSAKLNGHNILTDETFQGPFIYKGEVNTLPVDANAGDVYICDGKVSIYNGTSYDSFIIPVGMVSKAEYDVDQVEIKQDISTNTNDIAIVKEDVTQLAVNVGAEISKINTALADTVNKNPVDEKVYVRQNDEWVELSTAANTVKSVVGESSISNGETGVNITSPKVEINSTNIKVNGTALTQADKFALTKTQTTDDVKTWYELQYKRSLFSPVSSFTYGYTVYDSSRYCTKNTNNQKWTVTTRDYQYAKTCDNNKWEDDTNTSLTSMDKNGNIKEMYFPSRQLIDAQNRNFIADWMVWNPEFCPEGYENKAYLFFPWTYDTSDNRAYLLEYDNGEFAGSYDLTQQMLDQGATLQTGIINTWNVLGEGGKALRNKGIERICWISHNTTDGGDYAVILGGNLESKVTDKFDPSKCIYIKLPAVANPGYGSMAATDSAWYVSEYGTGRIMRITPNGRVTEYSLSVNTYKSSAGDYIEYTDKNGRPACAFRVWVNATNGKQAILFFEEREDGGVNFEEVDMSPYVHTGWDSSNWRMMENDYYIFFTAGYGFGGAKGENIFPSADSVKKLFYWDKKSHTTHIIDDLTGIAASDWAHSYIDMCKTKEKAVWFIPHIQTLTPAQRTGELKYILNRDYTNINEETGKDEGHIDIQSANIGANHPWFTCNDTYGWNSYVVQFHDTSDWGYTSLFAHYASVNDDGIGFLMSPDYKAFALFYGEGNIKVYEISSKDSKATDFNPNVQQMMPDDIVNQKAWLTSCYGLKHGWVISGRGYQSSRGRADIGATTCTFKVYIGIHYKNGEPTILERPTITILRKQNDELSAAKHSYDFYSYLLTYDDYERRNKILRGIFKEISYGYPTRGIDGYYKEVEHNSKSKINLEYDGKVISSVEE